MQVKKQQLEPDMEKWTVSKSGKDYVKTVYWHPAYLTSVKSTSCEIPGWMGIKIARSFLMKVKAKRGKVGLKLNMQKT